MDGDKAKNTHTRIIAILCIEQKKKKTYTRVGHV